MTDKKSSGECVSGEVTGRRAENLEWKVHVPNLLAEIVNGNDTTWALATPLTITGHLLHELAEVARKVDDPRLHRMMLRLTLYEQGDPASPHFDPDAIQKMDDLEAEREASNQQSAARIADLEAVLRAAGDTLAFGLASKTGQLDVRHQEAFSIIKARIDAVLDSNEGEA